MKSTSSTFKQIMASGNARKYLCKIDLTLTDNTVLHLTEEDVWGDSLSIETASSGTSSFDIGTAVIGQCKFALNNFDERFNQYDFFNASAVVWVGLEGDLDDNDDQVYYRMGFFTVDEPSYAGALIQLVLLDNMWKFDVPLSNVTLTYPITALNAILAVCTYCGVQLDQTSQFHGYNFSIAQAPEQDMNCREFIQYIAMIGCNFCIITPEGKLKLRWYDTASIPSESDIDGGSFDTNTTPYSDGDSADGGTFSDYTSGDSVDGGTFTDNATVDYFTRNFNSTFGTDVIEITGVKFVINDTAYSIGTAGYVLELDNPLVNADNVTSVLNLIWDVLQGFSLRTFNITTASDLAAEIGDCCAIKDYKGNFIYSWITNNIFKFTSHIVQCNAINPTRTLTKQYSKTVQAAVEVARQQTDQIISNYDLAVQYMNNLAVNAMGAYEDYEDLSTGGRIYYMSNRPITKVNNVCSFEAGSTVYKKSGDGFFVSRDGGTTWTNGYDMQTGELVVNVLDAIGINFDWARGGTLTLGGYGNGNGYCEVKDASNNTIVIIDNAGITMYKGVIQSPDYAEVSGNTYATTGMKIDVINKLLKTPYFAINTDGAFFKGTIEIRGDIELGTGSLDFRPTDYYLADDFKFLFQAAEGYSGSSTVLVKHHWFNYNSVTDEWEEASSSPSTDTYTLTDDEELLSNTYSHTVGQNGHDYYEVNVTSSSTVTTKIKDAILAKVDNKGFHGVLEGFVKGRVESRNGRINGWAYESADIPVHTHTVDGHYGQMFADGEGNKFSMNGVFKKDTGETVVHSHGGLEVCGSSTGTNTAELDLYADETVSSKFIKLLVPETSGQDLPTVVRSNGNVSEDILWRGDITYGTTDLTAGTSPLDTGKIYLVYE